MASFVLVTSPDRAGALPIREALRLAGIRSLWSGSLTGASWSLEERPIGACLALNAQAGCVDDVTAAILRHLNARRPGTPCVVSGMGLGSLAVTDRLSQLHPGVLIHPTAEGAEAGLIQRLSRLLVGAVGDIETHRGVVIHRPTGDIFVHPVADRLVAAYPNWVPVSRSGGGVTAVFRLRRWLQRCGSSVTVQALRGTGEYRIVCPEG